MTYSRLKCHIYNIFKIHMYKYYYIHAYNIDHISISNDQSSTKFNVSPCSFLCTKHTHKNVSSTEKTVLRDFYIFLLLCRPRNPFLRSLVLYHYLIFSTPSVGTTICEGILCTCIRIHTHTHHIKPARLFPRKADWLMKRTGK